MEVTDRMTKLTATIQHLSVGGGTAPPLCVENSQLLAKPEKYDGNPAHGKGFLLQCELYLASCGNLSDHQEIVNIISLLIGKALTWATVLWERKGKATKDYNRFLAMFRRDFDHSPEGKEVGERLLAVKQGNKRVAGYTLEFCTLAEERGSNELPLKPCSERDLTWMFLLNWPVGMTKLH